MKTDEVPGAKSKRPMGVAVLAAVAFIGGVFGILGGGLVLSGATSVSPLFGTVVVVFGVLGPILGVGFFIGASWAWVLGLVVYVLSIPLGIAEVLSTGQAIVGGVIRLVVGLVIIYYLTRPRVKAFFRK
jgi:uncharacterized membrane protein (DUF2068 family)